MTVKKLVVGVTGASGAPYARRLIGLLEAHRSDEPGFELAVCISSTAEEVWRLECGVELRDSVHCPVYEGRNYKAPFASGSAGWDAMVIAPCSMGTLSRIAHGTSESLLTRAADVMLKERRKLICVPREMPLGTIHLENMLALSRHGAVILPAMPAFYGRPNSVDALIDTVVARVLDHLEIRTDIASRWGSPKVEVEERA